MKKYKYKIGDRVWVRKTGGGRYVGTIEDIEEEDGDTYVDLIDCTDCKPNNGYWCYIEQIISKW